MSDDVALHRHYLHYSELPYSMRVLYTAALLVLSLGYLFALIYLYHTYAGRAGGDPKVMTYDDLVVAYAGTGKGSRLESALRGPMSTMLPADESQPIIAWVQAGADRAKYDKDIKPVIDKRCMSCHDGSNPHIPNLGEWEVMKKLTEQDTGADIFTLVRVSHIHLFGLTFIFFIVGLIFSHAYVRPVWFKCLVIGLPFLCNVSDILSWYMVKVYHPFAWVTMGTGALYGMCFAYMWVVSMYQLWFSATPKPVVERGEVRTPVVG
ncbi:MAG TPA: elongation factor-1 alpha [Casimicrobiaceae bacterium]|nr:elongation factor-1 alpha [Casimicrobiaceae bacterium]